MQIPDPVRETFERLKSEYKFYIVLSLINRHYYVYRHQSIWDKTTKKRKTKSEYLGKITEDGAYIKRSMSKEEKEVEFAKAVIESRGGKVLWPSPRETQNDVTELEDIDDKILTILSANARESAVEIGRKLGMSESSVSNKIKKLEKTFGIRYTIDATLDRFHHYRFVAIVNFIDDRPNTVELQKLFAEDPRIRLALSTRGAYDLFIFMFVNGPLEAEELVYKLRSSAQLSKYESVWQVTYHSQSQGFIPPREKFFELLKERIWKRTKENPRKKPGQFFYREYAVIKELSQNSTISFSQIDEKYELKHGSAQNTYHRLIDDGSIRNATITMEKPPIKATAVIVMKQINIEEYNTNKKEYFNYRLTDGDVPLNKFIFSGDLGAPYGLIMIAPLYKDGDLDKLEVELGQVAKGTEINTSIVTGILVGDLGFRKIEGKHAHLYAKLQETEGKN